MKELRVSPAGLRAQAAECRGAAETLAEGDAPAVAGSTWLPVAAAVGTCHGRADAAKRRCGAFLQQTNEKLSTAAANYSGTDAGEGDALDQQMPT
jgi:hypothetical protein